MQHMHVHALFWLQHALQEAKSHKPGLWETLLFEGNAMVQLGWAGIGAVLLYSPSIGCCSWICHAWESALIRL
jgi:hypothetical protein